MTVFAGWIGAVQVAAYQIGINMIGLVFMTALGVGGAGGIRVGHAVGRANVPEVRRAGWISVGLGLGVAAGFGAVMFAWPQGAATLYSDDSVILAVAVPTLAMAGIALVMDCSQGVIMGVLRGAGDVWPATLIYLFSFWVVMLPIGYHLGVSSAGGAPGLMVGVAAGAMVAALLLGVRFQIVSARPIHRV